MFQKKEDNPEPSFCFHDSSETEAEVRTVFWKNYFYDAMKFFQLFSMNLIMDDHGYVVYPYKC